MATVRNASLEGFCKITSMRRGSRVDLETPSTWPLVEAQHTPPPIELSPQVMQSMWARLLCPNGQASERSGSPRSLRQRSCPRPNGRRSPDATRRDRSAFLLEIDETPKPQPLQGVRKWTELAVVQTTSLPSRSTSRTPFSGDQARDGSHGDHHPLRRVSRSATVLRRLSRSAGVYGLLRASVSATRGAIFRLTIHACLPTCRPRVNPYCSNSSTVALNRNRS